MKIGVAGIGRMGSAVSARLMDCGCSLAVWNRTPAAAAELVDGGAALVGSSAELWGCADIVISCLAGDQALLDVLLNGQALIGEAARGKLLLDISTVQPATIKTIAQAARQFDCTFLDCPVLGTTDPARQGQLIVMVGGTSEDFARAKPVLDLIARKIFHIGPVGNGSAMKLSVNIPMAAYWVALSEGITLAQHYGLSVESLIDVVSDSPAALAQLPLKRDILLGVSGKVGFSIDGVVELLTAVRAAGSELNLPLIDTVHQVFQNASTNGFGGNDVATIKS